MGMKFRERLFSALLRLLPAEFRGEYERELTATFRAERDATGGRLAAVRLWAATIADIFRTAPGEHLDLLGRDLSYAVRMLRRRPTLTVTAIATLALGVGANTAIFSVVNGVLFAPLPYRDADRVVLIEERRGDREPGTTGYYSFVALRDANGSLDSIAAFSASSAILAGDGKDAERVAGARVSWNYFRTLGLQPALGRDFDQSEDHPERRRVAIISDALWKRRYGGDPSIIGKSFTISQVTYTLAGVLPAGLDELVTRSKFPDTEIWTLLGYSNELPQACRSCRHIHVVGRLKGGTSVSQAAADLTRVYQSLAAQFPTEYERPSAVVTSVRDYFLGPARRPLYVLWAAVAVLLLIACANIANLLLIRANERDEEIAIRRALGVSPARMLRQLLTEAILLATLGGAAGAVLAWWATGVLVANGPAAIPRLNHVAVDLRVLFYAIGVSLLTGVLFGMAPARLLIAGRDNISLATRRATAGPTAWRHRAALIATNVALSTLLLVGSGLLVRSFLRLTSVDSGFTTSGVLTFQIGLSGQRYAEIAGINTFYDTLAARLRALPGVDRVSGSTQLPLSGSINRSGITIEGRVLDNPAAAPNADRFAVRPDYFATVNIPLRRGRVFSPGDTAGTLPVAIVGETMARELWPGQDPIGQRIRIAGGDDNPMRTIVGVVGDVRHYGLHLPGTLQVYMPHAQMYYTEPGVSMIVRVTPEQDPLALAAVIRSEVRSIDPLQPVTMMRTFDAIVSASLATRRFTLALLLIFAVTALLLAVVGLYGALSYVVGQRRREIGVRVALGASAREIGALVVRQGMTPAMSGLVVGLAASAIAGRGVQSLLYDTQPRDLTTFAVVMTVMTACAVTACLLPAAKATCVDPAAALKAE
jgi:putative ABC transport system permease protein